MRKRLLPQFRFFDLSPVEQTLDEGGIIKGDIFTREIGALSDGPVIMEIFEKALRGHLSVVSRLIDLTEHQNVDVARHAALVLGDFPGPAVVAQLKKIFYSETEIKMRVVIRVAALVGLCKMEEPDVVNLCRFALSHQNPYLQLGAVGVLGLLKDHRQGELLLMYLDSPLRRVLPKDIFKELGKLGDLPGSTAVRDRLVAEAFNKRNEMETRMAAAFALRAIGREDLAHPLLNFKGVQQTFQSMGQLEWQREHLAKSDAGKR